MSTDILRRAVSSAILCLVQVLVLNQVHLFGCATPLLYIYVALTFPLDYPRWGVLLWCFAVGLVIDAFSNTPGLASASMTLAGLVQPYLLRLFVRRDDPDNITPSVAAIGFGKYFFYAFLLVFLYCLCLFSLEVFNFYNWVFWLECVAGSTAVTVLLVITLDSVRRK